MSVSYADLVPRFEMIERRLSTIERHLGITPDLGGEATGAGVLTLADGRAVAAPSEAVIDRVRAGDLIGAIKEYRLQTNYGLAEAKAVVEQLPGV